MLTRLQWFRQVKLCHWSIPSAGRLSADLPQILLPWIRWIRCSLIFKLVMPWKLTIKLGNITVRTILIIRFERLVIGKAHSILKQIRSNKANWEGELHMLDPSPSIPGNQALIVRYEIPLQRPSNSGPNSKICRNTQRKQNKNWTECTMKWESIRIKLKN